MMPKKDNQLINSVTSTIATDEAKTGVVDDRNEEALKRSCSMKAPIVRAKFQ